MKTKHLSATIVHWVTIPTLKMNKFARTAHWDGLLMRPNAIDANPVHEAILAHTPKQRVLRQDAAAASVARIQILKEGPKPMTAKGVPKVDGVRQFMLRKNQLANFAGLENMGKTPSVPMHWTRAKHAIEASM